MDALKIKVILGSTRQQRFGEQPAKWIFEKAKAKGLDVELLDLRDYPLPFFDEPVSPSMIKEPYAEPNVAKWTAKIAEADAFVMIAAEYNHGYTAVLKNAIDYVGKEWHKKPVAFVGYGSVGGGRAVEQLREVAIETQMAPVRNAVHLTNFWGLLDEKGAMNFSSFEGAGDGMLDQLVWWAKALKTARDADAVQS
ncbi:MAG: NAD(P)H-dependent oxidoreductase [Candidatus Pacebacteria bacterium]|nr:NAD(P)H-dependent oxidoreductase [Candidatus Paceibacterota bacterium]